jgi:hypothetical protein
MNKQEKGIVYTVTNKKTKEVVYIGITKKSVESRKKDHIKKSKKVNKKKSYAFQNAIATLGIDAFKWESDNTLFNNDDLAQHEKELIKTYKAKGCKLLNQDSGGGFRKSIYQYKIKDGSLVGKYDFLEDAAKSVNSTKKHISNACLSSTHIYKGFYWSYLLKVPFQESSDLRLKQVMQLSLHSGKKITTFKSVADANKITGINKTCIAKCCRNERKSAGGYKWIYI